MRSKFENYSNSFICKNERIAFNGTKLKMKVDFKEEDYHEMSRTTSLRDLQMC